MRENCTSGSMRRGEKRVMVYSANGHRTRKGGNGGAPPDLYTTALASHSTRRRMAGFEVSTGVNMDRSRDLALLTVDAVPSGVGGFRAAQIEELQPGDPVAVIGH